MVHPVLNPLHGLAIFVNDVVSKDEGVSGEELEGAADEVVRPICRLHVLVERLEGQVEQKATIGGG